MRGYYLSRFDGTGRDNRPFHPYIERFGRCWMIDLRIDETMSSGWCLAALENADSDSERPRNASSLVWLRDIKFLYLTDDLDERLRQELIHRIELALGFPFKLYSTTLRDIIAEVLLCSRDLRPDHEGRFRICLGGTIWESDQEEAFGFVARCRYPHSNAELTVSEPGYIDYQLFKQDVALVEGSVDSWDGEWKRHKRNQGHILLVAIREAKEFLRRKPNGPLTHNIVWLRTLARSISAVQGVVPTDRLGSRLASDVERVLQENLVAAAYIRANAVVTSIDDNPTKSAEYTVSFPSCHPVHIECKRKSVASLKFRSCKREFARLNQTILGLMKEIGVDTGVLVNSKFNPTDDDIPRVKKLVESLLTSSEPFLRDGKLCVRRFEPLLHGGLCIPKCDYGSVEGNPEKARGLAWITGQRFNWVRSVLGTIKKSAHKFSKDTSNIVYLEIPSCSREANWLRLNILMGEVLELIEDSHQSISAVVLTSMANCQRRIENNNAMEPFIYPEFRIVINRKASNPLPSEFQLYGRDF